MRVELLTPDAPAFTPPSKADPALFARALDAVGSMLQGANAAEDSFANGSGSLQNSVYERARADVDLSVATATAQRAAQALTSILNLQI